LRDLITKSYAALKALLTRRVTIVCDNIPFEFYDVPLKKLLNRHLVHASFHLKPGDPWGWPTHLQIEPDAHCNLHCVVCPVTTGLGRPIGRMEFRIFQKLIDEVGDYLFLILLWDWGEPFLNPDVYEMIAYAKEKGIQLVSSTNGHLLIRGRHVDDVIRSGLDWLIVAVDGVTQETYELYRQGGDLEMVLEGVRLLVERKRALSSETPRINLRFVVMKQNEHEIPKVWDLAKALGVDALTLKTMNPYGSDLALLPEDPRYRRFQYAPDGTTRLRRGHNPCLHLWHMPAIHWNGAVCMCTYDSHEEYVFGNLHTDTFKSIWFGDAYRRTRRQFQSDWEGIPLCNGCSYAYKGGSCIDEIIADAAFFGPQ
jgi:radical SAM protein with 4Fe4S-binding SPASM domain